MVDPSFALTHTTPQDRRSTGHAMFERGAGAETGRDIPLHQGLTAVRVGFARRAPKDRPSVFDAGLAALRGGGVLEGAAGAGQHAWDFTLPDNGGAAVCLHSLLARGPVVLTVFRGGWCPYCSLQLGAYQAITAELDALGATLVAISPQTGQSNRELAAREGLRFPLLSDAGNRVARRYGLVAPVPQAWRNAYEASGIDLAAINDGDDGMLPTPGTFVIEPSGRIALSFVDLDYRNRLEPAEILDVLRSLGQPPIKATEVQSMPVPRTRKAASPSHRAAIRKPRTEHRP